MSSRPKVPTPQDVARLPPLIRALLTDPACYPHTLAQVQLAETHISWVLLTGEFAYKIKKPVDLGFLDFSTLPLRKQSCEDEVRLNRRLAPDFYLGVAPIAGSLDAPRIDGHGEAFEYAVKMRQFPPDCTLDRLDERGELGTTQIDRLSARLAQFHLVDCPIAPPDSPWGEPRAIANPVAENFRVLEERLHDPTDLSVLASVKDWSDAEHKRLTPLMRERKRLGMVRECHGDLHLANLAWAGGQLIIFDCIEFNAALRWIDVISEVAFCYMDLLHRGHRDLAHRFLNSWLEGTGDYGGLALLRYYAVYRAMVRAKVAALRGAQEEGEDAAASRAEAAGCIQLAAGLTQFPPRELWVTHGFSGCGKTTQSQLILEQRGMVRLRSDVERKRLAGLAATQASGSGIETGIYAQDSTHRTYERLADIAAGALDAGWPVIVDAAFLRRWQRDLFRTLAPIHGASFRILDIEVEHGVLRERLAARAAHGKDASEADMRVLDFQIETADPLDAGELSDTRPIATDSDLL